MNDTSALPVTYFNCTLCDRRNPITEQHVCIGLTKRQLRKLEIHRAQVAAEEARRSAPIRCQDCGVTPPVGQLWHYCTGRSDPAMDAANRAQLAGVVSALQRAGLTVTSK